MGTTILLFAVGLAGSFVFDRFHLPGGAMTGAMIAVVIFKSCGSITSPDMAHWVRFIVYGCVGVLVGNMYNPGMLDAVRDTWPMMLLSTGIILMAGLLCTWIAVRWGGLSVGGAYLATSPGGFNAVVALSGGTGAEAPMVMVYHLVRIYAIVLLSPIVAKMLSYLVK